MTARRKHVKKAVREAVWERDGGACVECGSSDVQLEHELPDWLGGAPSVENLRLLCVACHKVKTRRDVKIIAKAKRQRRYHETGRSRARKGPPMRSRGFQGWRNFKGEIVRKGA